VRNSIDFSSLHGIFSTLLGLVVVSLVAIGIRLLFMHAVQRRRERENRQVNERLKVLIAAYKTLGGSFTGDLTVDPTHLRDLRRPAADSPLVSQAPSIADTSDVPTAGGSERRRRVRDAVEAALSDVILLGTDEQVRLAARAAADMVAGRRVETAALVVSLRSFVREVLELDPIPAGLLIPDQGPLRAGGAGGRGGRGEKGSGPTRAGAGGTQTGGGAAAGIGMHAPDHDDTSA